MPLIGLRQRCHDHHRPGLSDTGVVNYTGDAEAADDLETKVILRDASGTEVATNTGPTRHIACADCAQMGARRRLPLSLITAGRDQVPARRRTTMFSAARRHHDVARVRYLANLIRPWPIRCTARC